MNNETLTGLKNFISNNIIKKNSIRNADINNDQLGGNYLNDNDSEINFLSDNFIAKSHIPDSGYGVFANKDYKEGDVVEINRFLEFVDNNSGLENYVFKSHLSSNKNIIVLGNGSVFNHHDNNNVNYYYINKKGFFMYKANKDINKGEELYINYGSSWFSNRQKNNN